MDALLCERILSFSREGGEPREVIVGVGRPYTPVPSPGGERFAGCKVCVGSPESLRDVYAADALQALGTALASVDAYLAALATMGELRWPDGRAYDAQRDSLLAARTPFKWVSEALGQAAKRPSNRVRS